MRHPYMESLVEDAMDNLGDALDYAVNQCGSGPDEFFQSFIDSGMAEEFGTGDHYRNGGCSGLELARDVLQWAGADEDDLPEPLECAWAGTPEYWAGWALAWYQWQKNESFEDIVRDVPVSEIVDMYHPLHEASLEHFEEALDERRGKA